MESGSSYQKGGSKNHKFISSLRSSTSKRSNKNGRIPENWKQNLKKLKRFSSVKRKRPARMHKRLRSLNSNQIQNTLFKDDPMMEDSSRKSMTAKEFISTVYQRMQMAEQKRSEKIEYMRVSLKRKDSPDQTSKESLSRAAANSRASLKRGSQLKEFLCRMKKDIDRRNKNKHKSIFDSAKKKRLKDFDHRECSFEPNKETSRLRKNKQLKKIMKIEKIFNKSEKSHNRENLRIIPKERFQPLIKPSTGGSSRKSSLSKFTSKWQEMGYYRQKNNKKSPKRRKKISVRSLRHSRTNLARDGEIYRSSKNLHGDQQSSFPEKEETSMELESEFDLNTGRSYGTNKKESNRKRRSTNIKDFMDQFKQKRIRTEPVEASNDFKPKLNMNRLDKLRLKMKKNSFKRNNYESPSLVKEKLQNLTQKVRENRQKKKLIFKKKVERQGCKNLLTEVNKLKNDNSAKYLKLQTDNVLKALKQYDRRKKQIQHDVRRKRTGLKIEVKQKGKSSFFDSVKKSKNSLANFRASHNSSSGKKTKFLDSEDDKIDMQESSEESYTVVEAKDDDIILNEIQIKIKPYEDSAKQVGIVFKEDDLDSFKKSEKERSILKQKSIEKKLFIEKNKIRERQMRLEKVFGMNPISCETDETDSENERKKASDSDEEFGMDKQEFEEALRQRMQSKKMKKLKNMKGSGVDSYSESSSSSSKMTEQSEKGLILKIKGELFKNFKYLHKD
jgi:hypothetical protein